MKIKSYLAHQLKNLIFVTALTALPLAVTAATDSPSDLLEKGIYTEDTKGDLDAAITIYQQLVTEASAGQSVAAQGQYRLAQCYVKKNQPAEAKAAFEKLIQDYPNETELVAKARAQLPGTLALLPVPWVDGERLQLNITMGDGVDLGTVEYRSDLAQVDGTNVWRVGARMGVASTESVSSVDVVPDTFQPISSHWKHSVLGDVTAVYQPGRVVIQLAGKASSTTQLSGTYYDNEEAMDVFRRLPLKEGYKISLKIFSSLGGTPVPIDLEVVGKETVATPAGTFDCFKVQLSIGQTFWFSTDEHRYLVKFEAGTISATLNQISQRHPDDISPYTGPLDITLTMPAGWVFYTSTNGQPDGQILIRTFDPVADTEDGGLRLFPTETLAATNRVSSRCWAENNFAVTLSKAFKGLKVRPESWQDYVVDGRTGSSYVGDFTEAGKPRTVFALHVLGKEYSEFFVLVCPTDKFDGLKTAFDSIIASYHKP